MKRKQYAALPYRVGKSEIRILLITTRRTGNWSVPKGWPMKGCKPSKTAAREAFEEAGIRGRIGASKVGRFKHRKTLGSKTVKCAVDVFPLAVRDKLHDWPEKKQRRRKWFTAREAADIVKHKGLRRAIHEVRN
jgi:8-oxo-dGTP pyrophosphatase MutT (NUDIX family)